MRLYHLIGLVVTIGMMARPVQAVDITACNQTVAPYEVGVLQGDLSCLGPDAAPAFAGVHLAKGATLDLNGHTLTMLWNNIERVTAVECPRRCSVVSRVAPGVIELSGALPDPVSVDGAYGIEPGKVIVENVTVQGFSFGILAAGKFRVKQSKFLNNKHAAISATAGGRLQDVEIANGYHAISANGRLSVRRVKVTGMEFGGISTGGYSLIGDALDMVGGGISGVNTNSDSGTIEKGRVVLRNSVVQGHGSSYPDAPLKGDIVSDKRPRLYNVDCLTSTDSSHRDPTTQQYGTWGLCGND